MEFVGKCIINISTLTYYFLEDHLLTFIVSLLILIAILGIFLSSLNQFLDEEEAMEDPFYHMNDKIQRK